MENKNTSTAFSMQILTPKGFKPFDGVKRYWHESGVAFTFTDESKLRTSRLHRFIVNGNEVYSKDINVGDDIGKVVVDKKIINEGDYYYDPVNVNDGSVFSHDDKFVSHNTFHGTGNTLISGDKLLQLKAENPIYEQDKVRVYERPNPDSEYMMFVDVGKGRGKDYSTFNIIDISVKPFRQVAVFQDNLISPLLFPDVIYKYAKTYNEAYVVIENNDQGTVVCNGLYYELEYENVFVESAIKSSGIGVYMDRKVKRIGTSTMKDLIEQDQLTIRDSATIVELSTFVAKGSSYEASQGNHDDLVMNLVLLGWFSTTNMFAEQTDVDIKHMLYAEQMKMIEDDMVPFGIVDDGLDHNTEVIDGDVWVHSDTSNFGVFY